MMEEDYKEENKMIMMFPWKCPRTDATKVTAIVTLPSGVVPETVEFKFEGNNSFQSNSFSLTYEWPEKLMMPDVIYKVDMRKDRSFFEKNEFVEFRSAIRKLFTRNSDKIPISKISVKLPFAVQRSPMSYSVDLRRFGTASSAVLARGRSKEEFKTVREMATNVKTSDHKVYFVILRFTGIEVAAQDKLDKRGRCIEDCDESSLSDSDSAGEVSYKPAVHSDLLNKELYMENMSQKLSAKYDRKRRRR